MANTDVHLRILEFSLAYLVYENQWSLTTKIKYQIFSRWQQI